MYIWLISIGFFSQLIINIHIEAGGKKLEILSALEVDRGQYICVATSVAGEREIKYEVDVLGK